MDRSSSDLIIRTVFKFGLFLLVLSLIAVLFEPRHSTAFYVVVWSLILDLILLISVALYQHWVRWRQTRAGDEHQSDGE